MEIEIRKETARGNIFIKTTIRPEELKDAIAKINGAIAVFEAKNENPVDCQGRVKTT